MLASCQEDSLIANGASLDRGMFRSTLYRTYREEERTNGSEIERFEKPCTNTVLVIKSGNYDVRKPPPPHPPPPLTAAGARGRPWTSTGWCAPGRPFTRATASSARRCRCRARRSAPAHLPLQMTEITEDGKRPVKRDRSLFLRTHEKELVDSVLRATTVDGHGYAKVRTRIPRTPVVGDKLSSRHGQKGVIGLVMPQVLPRPPPRAASCALTRPPFAFLQEDMPFTREGITPDLIVNVHALPSRMTLGHLVETLCGKTAALDGTRADGTPFRGVTVDQLGDALQAQGYQRHGEEAMIDGTTGKVLKVPWSPLPLPVPRASRRGCQSQIFIGPTYYQRLKHMVADKRHARSHGPVNPQPSPHAGCDAGAGPNHHATAGGGPEPGRRAPFRRDGARLPHQPRRRQLHAGAALRAERPVLRPHLQAVRADRGARVHVQLAHAPGSAGLLPQLPLGRARRLAAHPVLLQAADAGGSGARAPRHVHASPSASDLLAPCRPWASPFGSSLTRSDDSGAPRLPCSPGRAGVMSQSG